jgi:predicted nucleic acid-binding protein
LCIIVDTNRQAQVFLSSTDPDFGVIHEAIFRKRKPVRFVYGGTKFIREIAGNAAVRRIILTLDRKGVASKVSDTEVDGEEEQLKKTRACRSDDEHIIALARASGSRFLVTGDSALRDDFKDVHLLSKPRGVVFEHIIKTRNHTLKLLDDIRRRCVHCARCAS